MRAGCLLRKASMVASKACVALSKERHRASASVQKHTFVAAAQRTAAALECQALALLWVGSIVAAALA
jgi:hypothetical protein